MISFDRQIIREISVINGIDPPKILQVRVIQCSAAQADRLELILITYLRQSDNSTKIKLLFEAQNKATKEKSYSDYKEAVIAMQEEKLDMEEDVPF